MKSAKDPLSACAAEVGRVAGMMLELVGSGRQAGFHVDWIVMRARRAVELLGEPSPNARAVAEQSGLIATDPMGGVSWLGVRAIWGEAAQAITTSDVGQAVSARTQLNNELTPLLMQSPVDLAAARAKAAKVLSAAEELRTRAYAFEDLM